MQEGSKTKAGGVAGSDIRDILLERHVAGDGKLFESAADLAKRIAALPAAYYAGKEKSVAGLLSLVFSGDRKCPQHLARAIVDAVADRLSDRELRERKEWIGRLDDALRDYQRQWEQQESAAVGISRKLAEAMAVASNRFLISPLLSDMRRTPTSRHTITTLVENLRMRDSPQEANARYTICFPHERDAVGFWREVFGELTGATEGQVETPLTAADAAAVLEFQDATDFLRVFQMPYHFCLTPTVLYRPERDDCIGFSLFYVETGKLIATEIPAPYIPAWRHFYADFLREKFEQQRISFKACREIVLKGL